MHVQVHSVKKTLFDGEAASITCKTTTGEITILNHHRPLIAVLERGAITIVDNGGKKHYLNVSSGFAEVQQNRASLIIEEEIA